MNRKILAVGMLVLTGSAIAQGTYTIDPQHSAAQFNVRHMMISNVKGEFSKVNGTITYDPKKLAASKIDVVIDANSIYTREPKRDEHLKSPDFFDTAKFPTLTFKSKQIRRSGSKLQARGDLTMHGVTREVVLDVEGPTADVKDPWGTLRFGASATTTLNRKDWGLVWNQVLETGGVMVGDEVAITIDIEATRNAAGGK